MEFYLNNFFMIQVPIINYYENMSEQFMTEEEVKLNYIAPAIEETGWSKKTNQNGILYLIIINALIK